MFGWWRLGSPSSSSRSGLSFPPIPLFCSGCPISLSQLLSPDDGPERRVCYSLRRRKSILSRLALRRQAPPNITSSARYLKGGGGERQIRACLSFPKVGAGRRSLFDERKTRILRSGDAESFTRISRGLMFIGGVTACYVNVTRLPAEGGELGWPFLPGLLLGDPGLNDK